MPVTAKMFCTVITESWSKGTRPSKPTLSAGVALAGDVRVAELPSGVAAISHLLL
jgi:hypothetical protein